MRDAKSNRPWIPIEIRKAAAIWQRDVADHYGEDIPRGVQHRTFITIASDLNRTFDMVKERFRVFGPSFSAGRNGAATAQALEDLARRKAAENMRSPAAEFFGDPPPGYSALDKKRAGLRP